MAQFTSKEATANTPCSPRFGISISQNYIMSIPFLNFLLRNSLSARVTREYNLKAIKIEPAGGQLGIKSSSSIPDTSSIISISNLFAIVKRYDKNSSPTKFSIFLKKTNGQPAKILCLRVYKL